MRRQHRRRPAPSSRLGFLLALLGTLSATAALTALASPPARSRRQPSCARLVAHPQPVPVPAPAGAPVPAPALSLSASTREVGCIYLLVTGAIAGSVTIAEVTPGLPAPTPLATLATRNGEAAPATGVEWRCDRTARSFMVTETLPDGSQQSAGSSLITPSCADRLSVSIPPTRLHRGYPVSVAVSDRWRLGRLRVRVCAGGSPARGCRSVTLTPGGTPTQLRLLLHSAGHVPLTISDPYVRLQRRLAVSASRPLLLATGDSEMQVLDEIIASGLSGPRGASVAGDARQSTALSTPSFFDWPAHARGQVAGRHPDIVAMFIGGNEGFPIGGAECCDARWSREYAARVAGMMHDYLQHGAAAVYWFVVPTPRSEPFVRVVRAVDRGIVLAAKRFPQGVHAFDLRPVFSPGGRYIESLASGGQTITVHESDGFHLSTSADRILARMFIGRLRADGLLP